MDTTLTLLNALYGNGSSSSGASTGPSNALLNLKLAEKNETKEVASTEQQPQVSRAIAAFKSRLAKSNSISDLLADPQARDVLLTANGLGDQTQYTALAQKALSSDTSDPNSVANKLSDTRWKQVANTYQFSTKGLSVLKEQKTIDSITNGYAEVQWRQSLDQTTPGLSNALDFRSRASTITSADQILGDKTFRKVVTKALGIPDQIAYQPLEAQEKAITDRLDIKRFQDPNYVESFTQRYLLQEQQSASNSTSSGSQSLEQLAVSSNRLYA